MRPYTTTPAQAAPLYRKAYDTSASALESPLLRKAYGLVAPVAEPVAAASSHAGSGPLGDRVTALEHEVDTLRQEVASLRAMLEAVL